MSSRSGDVGTGRSFAERGGGTRSEGGTCQSNDEGIQGWRGVGDRRHASVRDLDFSTGMSYNLGFHACCRRI